MVSDSQNHEPYPEEVSRVTILAGPYGSGKTEIAIDRAFAAATRGQTAIADLDIVNPYFRSRELRERFEEKGIRVIAPRGSMAQADLPAISGDLPRVLGDPACKRVLIDMGGDPAGARLLGHFRPQLEKSDFSFLMVVNPNRPFTSTPTEIAESLRAIEDSAGLQMTGVISNPHLINLTKPETVITGHRIVEEGAALLGLPVTALFFMPEFLGDWTPGDLGCPSFPFSRTMLPPWHEDMKRMAPYRDRRSLME